MPAWLAPAAISAGSSLLSGLFGGGESKQSYQMSPEMRQLYSLMMGEAQGALPSYLRSPIERQFRAGRRATSESMGQALGPGSGLEQARLDRSRAGESRALTEAREMHQMNIYQMLSNLLRGTGTQTSKQGTDWGSILGGAGGDAMYLWGLEEILKQGGQQQQGGAN